MLPIENQKSILPKSRLPQCRRTVREYTELLLRAILLTGTNIQELGDRYGLEAAHRAEPTRIRPDETGPVIRPGG